MNLTLFTAPKPFTNPHIATIQRNAIQSWLHLGEGVRVILVGDESGMAETATDFGVLHLPQVQTNRDGTPLVSSIFELVRQYSPDPLLVYLNADILLTPGFLQPVKQVAEQAERFLIVGQRWDLEVRQPLEFSSGWDARLMADVQQRGRLHPPMGSDYFVFPRTCFTQMPPFAIGRAGWDNWMFTHARLQGWPVVDATPAITIIHQDHDYSHLPGGQPHYRLPETTENIRLAGGRRAIFTLLDADVTLRDGRLRHIPLRGRKLLRELETFPLRKLRSYPLAELSFAIFHPIKAFKEWRGRIIYKIRR
jgi:hypothetical protein